MVRNSTRVALVVLAIVSVAGLPTVGFGADADVATGHAAASGPLTTEIDFTTTELLTTTESTTATTTETTATTTETTATTEATTATTTTTTDDSLVETTTVSDSLTNTSEGVTNETEGAINETTNETGEVTNETDELANTTEEATNETGELTNATGDSLAAASTAATDVMAVSNGAASPRLSVSATSSFVGTSTDSLVGTATSSLDVVDDEGSTTGSSSGGAPADGTAGTTTANDEATAADRDSRTATEGSSSGGSSTESDAPPDRPAPPTPSPPETAVSVGALTAAALLPQLADGLALVGNAGLVSASSVFVGPTRSRVRRGLRSRFDRLWRLFTPFRYSRWDNSDPLDHEGREALYEAIERSPGAYLSAVCESAEVPVSTARHHLDVLEEEGMVTAVKVRGKRRFYPGRADEVELTAALADEGTAPVLHALASLGGAHGGLLADELGRDPSTVSHHLSRLEDAGLVEREREGRAVVNRLTPEVREVLLGDEEADAEADEETEAETESETETPAIAD